MDILRGASASGLGEKGGHRHPAPVSRLCLVIMLEVVRSIYFRIGLLAYFLLLGPLCAALATWQFHQPECCAQRGSV